MEIISATLVNNNNNNTTPNYYQYSNYLVALVMTIFLVKYLHSNFRVAGPTARLPPGPSGRWPILGSLPAMWRNGGPASQWIHRLMEELDTDIACVRLGNAHVVAVSSPEIAKEFLKTHDATFASRPLTAVNRTISGGFLTVAFSPDGEQWKKMKRVLRSEVMTNSRLVWMLKKTNQEADCLVRLLYNQCSKSSEGKVVNVRNVAKHFPGNVMRRLLLGKRHFGKVDIDKMAGPEEEEHVSAIFTLLVHAFAFSVSDYLPWLRMLDLDGQQRKVYEAMKIISKYHDPIIDERVEQWREGKRTEPEDVLDIFISLKGIDGNPVMSVQEIRAIVLELFMASVDNTYNIVEWALSELLNHPEVLKKVVKELDAVVGKEKIFKESDIPNLPYMVACGREALRLHPIVPFNLPHVSNADCNVAGYFIPKGSSVLLSRLGLGRSPTVWEDPLAFDPSRHLKDCRTDLAEPELRFISFTTGRRGCAGSKLGSNLTLILLGRLLQGFTWDVPDGLGKIDLTNEGNGSLFKAVPLYANAKPRLNRLVYSSLFSD